MQRASRARRWAELAGVALLALLCVAGAFLGSERARGLFNSAPLAVFWLTVCVWMAAKLIRARPPDVGLGLRLALLGAILVLIGGLWGSGPGHGLADRLLGRSKIAGGCMLLPEGRATSEVFDGDLARRLGRLPFELLLRDFRIRLDEAPGAAPDYTSDLVVLEGGQEAARQTIGANRPLHYGGYHFYQYGGDTAEHAYTVLLVKSDSGLLAVYAGLALLSLGIFGSCWLGPALKRRS